MQVNVMELTQGQNYRIIYHSGRASRQVWTLQRLVLVAGGIRFGHLEIRVTLRRADTGEEMQLTEQAFMGRDPIVGFQLVREEIIEEALNVLYPSFPNTVYQSDEVPLGASQYGAMDGYIFAPACTLV